MASGGREFGKKVERRTRNLSKLTEHVAKAKRKDNEEWYVEQHPNIGLKMFVHCIFMNTKQK